MQHLFEKLFRAESMSQEESQQLFAAIVRGELEPSQLAAVLISMKVRGRPQRRLPGQLKLYWQMRNTFHAQTTCLPILSGPAVMAPTVLISPPPVPLSRLAVA